jgi:beta-aspartyl-peptidase (threonine type)
LQFTAAGAITRSQLSQEQELRYIQALSDIVETGQRMLEDGRSALDVVTEAVRLLEECPLFNAGIGAVYTRDETHELDACVMDGNTLNAGAVAGVSHLRNPILAARLVMEHSPHVMMIGEGAENFAIAQGMERVSADISRRQNATLNFWRREQRVKRCWTIARARWMKTTKWVPWVRSR